MLDVNGNVIGVVVSRVERDDSGSLITGIGFAIPSKHLNLDPKYHLVTPPPELVASPTPVVVPMPMFTPTPFSSLPSHAYWTPIPADYSAECGEWREEVLEWIKQGNVYDESNVPPYLSCDDGFPTGAFGGWIIVGDDAGQLLPGLYEYRFNGSNIVDGHCDLYIDLPKENATETGISWSYWVEGVGDLTPENSISGKESPRGKIGHSKEGSWQGRGTQRSRS